MKDEMSFKEKRIRKITNLYYSNPEIQRILFEFSKNREISPRYFEGFGKRPDSFQYPGDVFELVKKGATSFHCSEELWRDPLAIRTGMPQEEINNLRIGWDLLIDIDSRYFDYSRIMAVLLVKALKFHGVRNIGVKFSGSKGFHLLVPWKAFPKKINEVKTSEKFPEYPRIITKYLMEKIKKPLIEKISELSRVSKYVKEFSAPKEVMPDLVLVSPRHLFRMPYSLHEKTALASIVIDKDKLRDFDLKDADPLKITETKNFLPDSEPEEASELLMQALDWHRENSTEDNEKKSREYSKIKLSNISERHFPPCIQGILKGLRDGRKRAVFVLINLFRSIGMDKKEVEKRLHEWNEKNNPALKTGIIKSQLTASYRKNPIMPPNCREYYQGIGVCIPDSLCRRIKNPVNYVVKKKFLEKSKKPENSNKFKKKR